MGVKPKMARVDGCKAKGYFRYYPQGLMALKLGALFDFLAPLQGVNVVNYKSAVKDVTVHNVVCDSRQVRPGTVFVAICGPQFDGHHFLPEVIEKGAVGLVVDAQFYRQALQKKHSHKNFQNDLKKLQRDLKTNSKEQHQGDNKVQRTTSWLNFPILTSSNTRLALAHMAHYFYQQPSNNMFCVGVTGTNGKTSVTYMAEHIFNTLQQPACVIGTIDSHFKPTSVMSQNQNTTPGAIELNKQLHNFGQLGARVALLEVSSHALSQHRADGLSFDAAVFTNLSQDHLDYHADMQAYFRAKQRLFTELLGGAAFADPANQNKKNMKIKQNNPYSKNLPTAVLNLDDPYSLNMFSASPSLSLSPSPSPKPLSALGSCEPLQLITYGQGLDLKKTHQLHRKFKHSLHLGFKITHQNMNGLQFEVGLYKMDGGQIEKASLECAFIGVHNVYNAVAALGVALAAGCDFKTSLQALKTFKGAPGRLQKIHTRPYVFIDYAHTPDALEKVLHELNKLKAPAKNKNSQQQSGFQKQKSTARLISVFDDKNSLHNSQQQSGLQNQKSAPRLISVFGCGGDRDKGKRPLMMQAALKASDYVVLTSDNPRTEEPYNIAYDCLKGLGSTSIQNFDDQAAAPNAVPDATQNTIQDATQNDGQDAAQSCAKSKNLTRLNNVLRQLPLSLQNKVTVQIDRKKAIHHALQQAKKNDIVLIAGKGHEKYQIIGHKKYSFDDIQVASLALENLKL